MHATHRAQRILIDRKIFQYTRGSGQGEKRLHAKRSIGIGGHISREDATGADLYRSGMERELSEEMIIEGAYQEQLLGFIYDDSSPVGRVHLGVVHLLTLENDSARARESEMIDPMASMPDSVSFKPCGNRLGFVAKRMLTC